LSTESPGRYEGSSFGSFVRQNLEVNQISRTGCALLHYACLNGWSSLLILLLKVPGVDVNQMVDGYTPLMYACITGFADCVRLLLCDRRTCLTHTKSYNTHSLTPTALEHAIFRDNLHLVKWFFALQDPLAGQYPGVCGSNHPEMNALLAAYAAEPHSVRQRMCLELGIATPASYFALFVLTSDDYFKLREENALCDSIGHSISDSMGDSVDSVGDVRRRFLIVAARLPMELQMVLSHRACESPRDIILIRDLDPAISSILSSFPS